LIAKGSSANMTDLLQDIQARDFRDSHRSAAPLLQEADAHYIDSTALSIERVVAEVLDLYDQVQRVWAVIVVCNGLIGVSLGLIGVG